MKKLTLDEFIRRAREVHGGKYDYSLTEYITARKNVAILCPIHGVFLQTPDNHLQGKGCPSCRYITIANKTKMSTNEFIKKAKDIHGDKYDYSNVVYRNNRIKVLIKCNLHDFAFEQSPSNHLNGSMCPICANESRKRTKASDKETFIERAKLVHGNDYDYNDVVYVNAQTKVRIYCKKHKRYFYQEPFVHLKGCGCPYCKSSKGENKISDLLNKHGILYHQHYKMLNDKPNILCNIKRFYADFFLPKYNLIFEYNGQQHYMPIKSWKGEDRLHAQEERDISFRLFCKRHNIRLVEISYKDFDKIDDIIINELNI